MPHILNLLGEVVAEDPVPISQQVGRRASHARRRTATPIKKGNNLLG